MDTKEFNKLPDRINGSPNPEKVQTAFPALVTRTDTNLEALAAEQLQAFDRLAEARRSYVQAASAILAAFEKSQVVRADYAQAVAGLPGALRSGRGLTAGGPRKPGSLALSDAFLRKAVRAYRAGGQ